MHFSIALWLAIFGRVYSGREQGARQRPVLNLEELPSWGFREGLRTTASIFRDRDEKQSAIPVQYYQDD
jgi:hypothetical protein